MSSGNFANMVFGSVVIIILLSVVAIPIIDDLHPEPVPPIEPPAPDPIITTYDNEGFDLKYSKISGTMPYKKIEYTPQNITADGKVVADLTSINKVVVVFSENFFIYKYSSTLAIAYQTTTGKIMFGDSGKATIEYNESDNKISLITDGYTNTSNTFTELFMPDPNGDYGLFNDKPVFVDKDKSLYSIILESSTAPTPKLGVVEYSNGEATQYIQMVKNNSNIPAEITVTTEPGEDDNFVKYLNTKVVADNKTINSKMFIAPIQYSSVVIPEPPQPPEPQPSDDGVIWTLIDIVPLMLVISFLVGLVGMALTRRAEI